MDFGISNFPHFRSIAKKRLPDLMDELSFAVHCKKTLRASAFQQFRRNINGSSRAPRRGCRFQLRAKEKRLLRALRARISTLLFRLTLGELLRRLCCPA